MSLITLTLTSIAQFEMGAQMSYLQGHGKNDNHHSLMGATVYGKYFITDNISVGSVVHAYKPTKSNYQSGNVHYAATDEVTNISTSFEIVVGKISNMVETYVGADLGVSLSNHNVEYVNDVRSTSKYMIKQSYVMLSPKVGINIPLGSSFGVYSQVQYNYSPGNGGPVNIKLNNVKSSTEITTEPISKYFNVDTGVYLKLGNLKTIL